MAKIKGLILILCFLSLAVHAQTNRYMVFLHDKDNSSYSISAPEDFLSAKAIARRSKQGIDITLQDLPVTESYVQNIRDLGVDIFYTSKWFNAALIQTDESNISAIEELAFVDSVKYIAPNEKLTFNGRKFEEEDTKGEQEVMNEQQLKLLGINTLHAEGFYGQGITIAFFDGGFSAVDTAQAFQQLYTDGRLLYQHNFVEHSDQVYKSSNHGTRVFSTVAGTIENEYQGVATEASYMLCVTEDVPTEYRIEEYNWLIAAEKADSAGVDIISSSLGYDVFDDPAMNYSFSKLDGKTAIITQAANIAIKKGMLVVVSVGNEGDASVGSGEWQEITAPADAENIISVGSIDSDGMRSSFSSRGPTADGRIKPEVVAYGNPAAVISSGGFATTGNGTSFAAPQVAGLAALLWQANPTLTNLEIRDKLLNLSVNVENPNNETGYGVPNFNTTLAVKDPEDNQSLILYPNPVTGNQLTIESPGRGRHSVVNIYNMAGQLFLNRNIEDQRITLDISLLPQGVYVLEMLNSAARYKARFVKF